MSQQTIGIGAVANDGTGDDLRTAGDKINDNFTELYAAVAASGASWKAPARVATTAAITLATGCENGDTIDGVTLATGDRVLVKNQAAPAENGIYVVAASGAPARSADADSATELVNAAVLVSEGTANADKLFVCTTNAPITLNTTALTFVDFTPSGSSGVDLEEAGTPVSGGPFTTLNFNSGATVVDAGGGVADVDVTGGGGGSPWDLSPPTAASMTLVNGTGTNLTLTDDADVGLRFKQGTPVTGDKSEMALQSIGAPASNWTATIRLKSVVPTNNYSSAGLVARYSTGGKHLMLNWSNVRELKLFRLNTASFVGEDAQGFAQTIEWFRLKRNGANIEAYYSADGKEWQLWQTQAIATHLGSNPDQIGFGVLSNRATAPAVVGSVIYFSFSQP